MRYKDIKAPKNLKVKTLLQMKNGLKKQPNRRMPKYAVAAACVFVVFTTTVFALTLLDADFTRFLKPHDDEQTQYLANGAYIVDEISESETGSIYVKQVIGDSNLTYVLFDFVAPKETVLNDYKYYFYSDDIETDFSECVYGIYQLPDDNSADNIVSFVCHIMTENKTLQGSEIKMDLNNLASYETEDAYHADNRYSNYEKHGAVATGNWSVVFDANFKSYSEPKFVNQEIEIGGYKVTVQDISISPISVTIRSFTEFSHEVNDFVQNKETVEHDNFPIKINYDDGTFESTLDFMGASSVDHNTGIITTIKRFDGVINVKEIASIEFFGKAIYKK